MATDLTKMVEEQLSFISTGPLYEILLAMAAEIEANREGIERLKDEETAAE